MGTAELNQVLREEIISLLEENNSNQNGNLEIEKPANGNPYVIMVVGVNGVGKTTTIGKLAHQFKASGLKVVLGAADTFRAAAVERNNQHYATKADRALYCLYGRYMAFLFPDDLSVVFLF